MASALDKLAKRNIASAFERVLEIPLAKIRFDPTQPRKAFHTIDGAIAKNDADYITELAESIENEGLIQNITVQEMDDGTYLVIVGECRTRAHLQLGRATIKAVVRNDLTNGAQRLLYQLAENVNRQDLTDQELAASIRDLMKGSDSVAPMTQVQIAKTLGKSEGWVSRFVKFADEELQRLWVRTGIADTVEKLYRISILPKSMQVDIMRRVELPEDHPEFLAKPLLRDVIDALAREVKIKKLVPKAEQTRTPDPAPAAATHGIGPVAASGPREYGAGNGVIITDPVGQALANEVISSNSQKSGDAEVPAGKLATGAYHLPEAARASILGMVPAASADSKDGPGIREAIEPPVNCRVSIASIVALLKALNPNGQASQSIDGVKCELNIPGPLAQLISNELTGIVVDFKEVPAILQIELAKLL